MKTLIFIIFGAWPMLLCADSTKTQFKVYGGLAGLFNKENLSIGLSPQILMLNGQILPSCINEVQYQKGSLMVEYSAKVSYSQEIVFNLQLTGSARGMGTPFVKFSVSEISNNDRVMLLNHGTINANVMDVFGERSMVTVQEILAPLVTHCMPQKQELINQQLMQLQWQK